jgi:hypothetical protein
MHFSEMHRQWGGSVIYPNPNLAQKFLAATGYDAWRAANKPHLRDY